MEVINVDLQIQWYIQQAPKEGEFVSGDGYTIKEFSNGYLVCIVDGLGHGKEAYLSSKRVLDYIHSLNDTKWIKPLHEFFTSVHEILLGSRGVVMSSLFINKVSGILEWSGVGNIEGVIFNEENSNRRKYHRLTNQNGIIGFNLPEIHVKKINLQKDIICVLFTDGLAALSENIDAILYKFPYYSLENISKVIFEKFRNPQDDALVWVGKFSWIR